MTTNIYFRPIIPLVLAMISGVLLGVWFPNQGALVSGVAGGCTVIIGWRLKQKRTAFSPPLILFTALGYLSIQSWIAPKLPSHHIIHYADSHLQKIVGTVDSFPIKSAHRQKFILHTAAIYKNNRFIPVSGRIRVTVAGNSPLLSKGDRISFLAKLRSIKNFNNPGGFDYKRHMLFKRVMVTAYVSWNNLSMVKKGSKTTCFGIIQGARRRIGDLIETIQRKDSQDVLKALVIGDRFAVSKQLRESFNRAGVGHLLAISGLHIGIVATVSFIIFQKLLSRIKIFLWNAWTKKGAVIFSLVPIWVYGLLAGMSPSTQRAVIMVIVFLMTFLFESEHDPFNTLALAAMVILVVHPPSLFSISFQLSFSAVLSIMYGLSRVRHSWTFHLAKTKKKTGINICRKLFYFFFASLFATLGTLPLLMLYFNQVSLVGLCANIIIVPLIGFIVVPLGLLSVFLYPWTISGASLCIKIAAIVLQPTLFIINFFSNLSFSAIKTITPTVVEICCYYVLLWAILNLKRIPLMVANAAKIEENDRSHLPKDCNMETPRLRWQKPVVFAVVLSTLVLSTDIGYWLYHRFWHNDLKVSIIDVGHGSACLLELPKGYTVLIDGGGFNDNSVFDVGARIVAPFLWRRKIRTVDTIVLSHANSDHVNGLIYIADNFNVKNVWTNNQVSTSVSFNDFLKVVEKHRIHMPIYEQIFGRHCVNGVFLDVCYPPVDFIARQKYDRWRDVNNNSLVLKVTFGSKSILFPGDIKVRAEQALVAMPGCRIDSTVLIAPHHGSKTSNSQPFIDKVSSEIVIVSAGRKGRFELPHPSVVQRYRQQGCRLFNTSRHGAVTILTDGETLLVKTTLPGAG